jgi:hypothetical protein
MTDVGALDIKNRLKAAAKAVANNTFVKTAANAVAPGVLNSAKNTALKTLEKVAPGAGTQVQNYVTAKETEYKNRIVSGMVITGVCAVAASYLLLRKGRA